MDCWIINNMDECDKAKTLEPATSEEIFNELAEKQKRWGFPRSAKNLEKLKVGDRIIFRRGKFKKGICHGKNEPKYSTGKNFIATAIIKSEPVLIEEYRRKNPNIRIIGYPSTGIMVVELENLHRFSNPQGILADELSIVVNKGKWFSYYQGSIIRCPLIDCERILKLNQ